MTIFPALLLTAAVVGLPAAPHVVARVQSPPFEVSLMREGERHQDGCTQVVEAAMWDGKRMNVPAGYRSFRCESFGRQQLHVFPREHRDNQSVVFEASGFGGDGDHSGPVLIFFNLTPEHLERKFEIELFSPVLSSPEVGTVVAKGEMLFSFCDVCDGPGLIEEELYLPVEVRFDGYEAEVAPAFDAEQAQAYFQQFEDYGRSLHPQDWVRVRLVNEHVRGLRRSVIELLEKTGWTHDASAEGLPDTELNLEQSDSSVPEAVVAWARTIQEREGVIMSALKAADLIEVDFRADARRELIARAPFEGDVYGSNARGEYVGVFSSGGRLLGEFALPSGASLNYSDPPRFDGEALRVNTTVLLPSDPYCCPSSAAVLEVELVGDTPLFRFDVE